MRSRTRSVALVGLIAVGCQEPPDQTPVSTLVETVEEAAGDNCAAGGTQVRYGADTNDDGVLDDSEVEGVLFVCNDAIEDTPPPEVLVEREQTFEPGFGCDQGYETVLIGTDDVVVNGELDDGEIDVTLQTCLPHDVDEDGFINLDDNCPADVNPEQEDRDLDGIGDACDSADRTVFAFTRGVLDDDKTLLPSVLYTVDLTTGAATEVGPTGHSLTVIRVHPVDGTLYGITGLDDVGGCDGCLVRIDPSTAAATVITPLTTEDGPAFAIPSLTFLSDGRAFVWMENDDQLVTIDLTSGDVERIGTRLSSSGHTLTVTDDDVVLFINDAGSDDVFRIDPTTGDRTTLGSLPEGLSRGSRGDMDPTTLLHVGQDSGQGTDEDIELLQMRLDGPPSLVRQVPMPEGIDKFHGFALDR